MYYKNMLELVDFSFGYIKKPLCLSGVSLRLEKGKTLGLYGGEGMGKTALLNVLSGLESQYAGSAKLDGKELSLVPISERRMSFLLSEPALINKTIRANLDFCLQQIGKSLDDDALNAELRLFGINRPLDEKIKRLSLCEKRLLTFVRAHIKNAPFVLIDDQTDGLNEDEVNLIKNAIEVLVDLKNRSKTAILAFNHEKSMVETDEKIYLSYTKAYTFKTLDELLERDLYCENYMPLKKEDMLLCRDGGLFTLCRFREETIKKKTQLIIYEKNALGSALGAKLDKDLADGENMRVVLLSKDLDVPELDGEPIRRGLEKGQVHLFDHGTGEKMI